MDGSAISSVPYLVRDCTCLYKQILVFVSLVIDLEGVTRQVSAWDYAFLGLFWMYNTILVEIFHFN
jgi:hypothetical protein